jgi:hypothetical protein
MAKNNNESEVTIFITEDLSGDKKSVVKSLLKIPCKPDKKDYALRIYDKNVLNHFVSTRSNLVKTGEGFEYDVTGCENDFIGCRFELAEIGTKKIVLSGKIAKSLPAFGAKADALSSSPGNVSKSDALSSSPGNVSKGESTDVNMSKTGTGN